MVNQLPEGASIALDTTNVRARSVAVPFADGLNMVSVRTSLGPYSEAVVLVSFPDLDAKKDRYACSPCSFFDSRGLSSSTK